jgi:hypothetical protein
MPNMPPYTTIAPPPTAELSNDSYTAYLFHFNETFNPQDDVNQTFNLELGNDTFSIHRQSPITLSLDASSKRVTVGLDSSAISIPVFIAVQYANSFNHNGTRQSRIDFGYNEVIDQQSFINGQGNGVFQIQNNSTNSQNYLIEMYGDATTTATGSIELYNQQFGYGVGQTYTITGGRIPSGAWYVNMGQSTSQQFSIGIQSGTGSETMTGGTMFLKITRV